MQNQFKTSLHLKQNLFLLPWNMWPRHNYIWCDTRVALTNMLDLQVAPYDSQRLWIVVSSHVILSLVITSQCNFKVQIFSGSHNTHFHTGPQFLIFSISYHWVYFKTLSKKWNLGEIWEPAALLLWILINQFLLLSND